MHQEYLMVMVPDRCAKESILGAPIIKEKKGKMKERFIEINGVMLDCTEYIKEVKVLQEWIKHDLKEYFSKAEFNSGSEVKGKKTVLKFYNKRLDIEIKIELAKKEKMKFV